MTPPDDESTRLPEDFLRKASDGSMQPRPTEPAEPPPAATQAYGSQPFPQQDYGQPTYGAPTSGQPGYGQAGYDPNAYPPQGYGQPPYGYAYPAAAPSDGQAVTAMVLGIIALALSCGYGCTLVMSPIALFLGRSAMKRIDESQGRLGGRGMAQAGFIMGIIGTVLLVLAILAVIVIIAIGVSGGFDDGSSNTY